MARQIESPRIEHPGTTTYAYSCVSSIDACLARRFITLASKEVEPAVVVVMAVVVMAVVVVVVTAVIAVGRGVGGGVSG